MLTDPELSALLEQAARNLETLEALARSADEPDLSELTRLRERLHDLRVAYTRETEELTRMVLARAVERRKGDRRGIAAGQPELVG